MPERRSFEAILTANEKRELQNSVFRDHHLVGIDLSGADLRGARFERTALVGCNLSGADLRGAHFVLCDIVEVVLTGAKFGDNRFYGTTVRGVAGLTEDERLGILQAGGTFQHPQASAR